MSSRVPVTMFGMSYSRPGKDMALDMQKFVVSELQEDAEREAAPATLPHGTPLQAIQPTVRDPNAPPPNRRRRTGKAPLIIQYAGKLWVADGHNRIAKWFSTKQDYHVLLYRSAGN